VDAVRLRLTTTDADADATTTDADAGARAGMREPDRRTSRVGVEFLDHLRPAGRVVRDHGV
jgi:hypothetical protein